MTSEILAENSLLALITEYYSIVMTKKKFCEGYNYCLFFVVVPGHDILNDFTKKRSKGQIRWAIILFSLGVMLTPKNQPIFILSFKLMILFFQCPGTTHITNFTRMPHVTHATRPSRNPPKTGNSKVRWLNILLEASGKYSRHTGCL